ncbi:f-box domain-containing protein, partial [Colletotrichum incanum]
LPFSLTKMQRLPIELMAYVADSLDLHDIFNLSLVCSQFRYLVINDDICRVALETNASYSPKVQSARSSKQYARCLRRLVKTRDAIATAAPYATAIVAQADEFIYCDGMLCYTHGHESLRLLNLYGSADSEIVIDTRTLLVSVLGPDLRNSRYKFRPLHFACGILSCLYSPPKSEGRSCLIILDLWQRRLLAAHRLESTSKVFVRNNREYLYYGTHSLTGDDGFKRWALKLFDICKEQWAPGRLDLEDLVGSDVGSTVCFEIIDDHFHGLSSLNTFEAYEDDWTSYYYGFRLPMGSSRAGDMQLTSKTAMWRRQHEEGPIDDRWSTLQLEKDPVTGDIMVLESRREWLVDECSSTRTSYRTALRFSERHNHSNNNSDSDSDSESDTEDSEGSPVHSCSTSTIAHAKPQREFSQFHRGDDGSTTPATTLSQCFIRSYNHSCETFIDLINDPDASDSITRRLQLRSISRFGHVRNNPNQQEPLPDGFDQGTLKPLKPCTSNTVSWWPPKIDGSQNNSRLAELHSLLNPRGHSIDDPISGVMDECSIVYAVGSRTSQRKRPLVFISFDPATRLPNLKHWPGGPMTLPQTRPKAQENDTIGPCSYPTPQSLPVLGTTSGNSCLSDGSSTGPRQPSTDLRTDTCRLDAPAWLEKSPAAYLHSACTPGKPFGFNFAS